MLADDWGVVTITDVLEKLIRDKFGVDGPIYNANAAFYTDGTGCYGHGEDEYCYCESPTAVLEISWSPKPKGAGRYKQIDISRIGLDEFFQMCGIKLDS